ncbi:MAG: DNA repair protein RecN [Candidatus Eremiobacteraeota bacterium]|nr:DNA repair protein RecN [Candidatus Eremiobacteraeota bacterium]
MLRRLEIENYGLIERARVAFSDGATMFTGETGSGKTMVIGALAFALGARANPEAVRRGAQRAMVTIAFEPDDALARRFCDDGFPVDPGEEATIVREMAQGGKSSVRLNGRAATASYVREFSERIVEFIGQHEAQRLLAAAYHLELLDRFGGDPARRARTAVANAHAERNAARARIENLQHDERTARERYDDARYGLGEIESAALQPGEDVQLQERRRFLDNAERIAAALRSAHEALGADDGSASSAFGVARRALGGIAEMGAELGEMADAAAVLQGEAMELAVRIARILDAAESNPQELETITARLDLLETLKRKYGGTLESVLIRAAEFRQRLDDVERRDERLAALQAVLQDSEEGATAAAATLSSLREASAARLASAVAVELKELALSSARFAIRLVPLDVPGAEGAESVDFSFAANEGEALRPLAKVASGGELSRVLLALVVVLAAARDRTALVFDEIDAGIGGATATSVGTRIGKLARDAQTICVTHVAQLATWADRHYVLEKRESQGSTIVTLREVSEEKERAAELARMLSGESHDVALAHARSLLEQTSGARA